MNHFPQTGIAYNVAVKDNSGKSNYEVFTMNIDGSNKKNITNNKDVAWTYKASKDKLLFISDRDTCFRCFFLYETDINGSYIKKISTLQLEDSWMDTKDQGNSIIVSGRIGTAIRHQLFIINKLSGQFKQLTNDTNARYSDPCFSPNSKQIAFVYKKNKKDISTPEEIYVMNIDGSKVEQLTFYPPDNISKNSPGYKAGAPQWHPTKNFISYISLQNGRHHIYAVSPKNKKQWKLTSNDTAEGWHNWSQDGKWLVFDQSNKDETQYHIMLMNWETKEVKQLTDTSHKYQLSPVFVMKIK